MQLFVRAEKAVCLEVAQDASVSDLLQAFVLRTGAPRPHPGRWRSPLARSSRGGGPPLPAP